MPEKYLQLIRIARMFSWDVILTCEPDATLADIRALHSLGCVSILHQF